MFSTFQFSCLHKVLCEISDKFSWQRIWDLSKKITVLQKYLLSRENKKFPKRLFYAVYSLFHAILSTISPIFDFSFFVLAQGALFDLKSNFSAKNLRPFKTYFYYSDLSALAWKSKTTKTSNLCHIFVILCHFNHNVINFEFSLFVSAQGALCDLK